MQIPQQSKRRRKGISVSLKHNNQIQQYHTNNRTVTPPHTFNPINKQYIKYQEPIYNSIQPTSVKIYQSYRGIKTPSIKFSYNNVGQYQENCNMLQGYKEQSLHQRLMENQKINEDIYQRKRNLYIPSNPQLRKYYPQPHQNIPSYFPVNIPVAKSVTVCPPIIITHFDQNNIPSTIPNTTLSFDSKLQNISPIKQQSNYRVIPPCTQFSQKIKQIKQQTAKIKQKVSNNHSITQQNIENSSNLLKNNYLNYTIKKQPKKQQYQFSFCQNKILKNENKQNNKKLIQRIQKLKFAQKKLLDIIKICDNNQ